MDWTASATIPPSWQDRPSLPPQSRANGIGPFGQGVKTRPAEVMGGAMMPSPPTSPAIFAPLAPPIKALSIELQHNITTSSPAIYPTNSLPAPHKTSRPTRFKQNPVPLINSPHHYSLDPHMQTSTDPHEWKLNCLVLNADTSLEVGNVTSPTLMVGLPFGGMVEGVVPSPPEEGRPAAGASARSAYYQ